MAKKEPLFEGTVNELLKEWHDTGVDKHWMDRGNRRIIVYPAPKAWEILLEKESNDEESNNGVSANNS